MLAMIIECLYNHRIREIWEVVSLLLRCVLVFPLFIADDNDFGYQMVSQVIRMYRLMYTLIQVLNYVNKCVFYADLIRTVCK